MSKRDPKTIDRLASYPWPAIRRAYGLWEVIGDVDENPVQDDSHHIATTLHQEGYGDLGRCPTDRRRKIERWFEDRKRFSPYVDGIAVERALWGEEQVVDNLTALELRVVAERLAAQRANGEFAFNGWRAMDPTILRRVEREVETVRVAMEQGVFTPIMGGMVAMGDTGTEIETIEVVPNEEPLFVPEPVTTPAEPVPA